MPMRRLSKWVATLRARPQRAFAYYLPRTLMALCTLVLLGVAGATSRRPVGGADLQLSTGRVVAVEPGGPAAQAGIRPGDIVLSVGGASLADTPLYRGKQPGDIEVLSVMRGDAVSDVPVILATPSAADRIWRLVPTVVAAGFWGGGVALLALRPRDDICRAFFRLSLGAAVALGAGQLSTFNVLWAVHLFVWTLAALPPLLSDAYLQLATPRLPWTRTLTRSLIGISGVVVLPDLLFLARFGSGAHISPLWPRWRTALLLYLAVSLLVLVVGLLYAYVVTQKASVRRRLRGVAFAVTVGFLPMVLLSLLPEIVWGVGSGLPFQVTFPFLLLVPLSHVYVITHYDLRGLDRVINRSLVVFLLGLVWGGSYLAVTAVGMRFLRDAPFFYPVVGVLTTVTMALIFVPLMSLLQQGVDYLFYGGWYDYRQVITQMSRGLSDVTSRYALGERLVLPVASGLRLRGAALYLQDPSRASFALVAAHGFDLPPEITDIEPDRRGTATDITPAPDLWRQRGIAWVLALQRVESKPVGWLLLGDKREDDFFEGSDTRILQTLREQATLAAESILLFDDLRETAHALEVAQQQLLMAHEEERRILSWKLHDGPMQDLIALSYDLYNCRIAARQHAPELGQRVESMRQEALRIKNALRTVCRELRSDILDVLGLNAAMHRFVYDLMQENDVVVYLDIPRRRMKLPDPVGITLYSIFQEALANAVAHSGEGEVWVCFSLEDSAYELRVWDQGRGFVVPERLEVLALRGHFGLITMRERAASIGARFEVRAQPGQGTSVRVWGDVDAKDGGNLSSLR